MWLGHMIADINYKWTHYSNMRYVKFHGYIKMHEQDQMESGKKLQWVNSNTFINGTDTNITIDGDNSINLDAATSIFTNFN